MADATNATIAVPIPPGDGENFDTIRTASAHNDLALISAIRKADRKQVSVICAVNRIAGGYDLVPLAVMVEDDPYALFELAV